MKLFVCLLAGCLYAAGAFAAENVYVVDGDRLEMGEVRIRLEGIDAPEYYQDCRYPNNKKYACGLEARQYLQSLVDQGKVTCIERDLDRYDRSLCTCYVTNKIGEKTNLNEAMVPAGRWFTKTSIPITPPRKRKPRGRNAESGRASS